jgi:hypothetical protein
LHRENVELAGLVGSLQQRLLFAQDRIRALEAPKEPTSAESAPGAPTDSLGVEMAHPAGPAETALVALLVTWWLHRSWMSSVMTRR